MAAPTFGRGSISWAGVLAAASFLAAAWAAIQVGFLISALTQDPPSDGSVLVFVHHDRTFLYSLIFHAVVMVALGLGAIPAWNAGSQVNRMARGARRTWTQIGYGSAFVFPALALFAVFQFSSSSPRYQIYLEDSLREIIRMETRLAPQGVTEDLVAYGDARVVEGRIDSAGRYVVKVVAIDGRTMVVGQRGKGEDPEPILSLARDIAESAGVEVDLSSPPP